MKKVMNLVLFLLMSAGVLANEYVSNIPPVAVVTSTPNQTWFYNLEDVVFSSGSSYDPDGYVNYTEFYINGVLQAVSSYTASFTRCFALDGSPSNGCYQLASGATTVTVGFKVRDNSGDWSSLVTKTYTIQEHKGRKYFVTDHIGNVRATVNRDGNVLGYDDYYPFGKVMPGRSNNTANPNDLYKFTGHERDDEAGLTIDFMNARTYDPITGRFMQVDPLSDQFAGWAPYHYVHNNPLRLIDPTGMAACEVNEPCKSDFAPDAGQIFNAQMNSVKEQLKGIPRFFKAKAIQISASLGFGTDKTGPADAVNAGAQITLGEDGVDASGNIGAGAVNLDTEEGAGVGVPGLLAVNPETGTFDASIPLGNGFSATVSHNTESGDSGGGVEWGIKEFFSVGLKLIFNFGENMQETEKRVNEANAEVERAIMDVDAFDDY